MTPMYPTKLLSETWSATSNSPLHGGTVEYHRNEQLNDGQQIVMKTENLQVENKCESSQTESIGKHDMWNSLYLNGKVL